MANTREAISFGIEVLKQKFGKRDDSTLLGMIGNLTCDLPREFSGSATGWTAHGDRWVKGKSSPDSVEIDLRKSRGELTYYRSYSIGRAYTDTTIRLVRDPDNPEAIVDVVAERHMRDEMNEQGGQVVPQDFRSGNYSLAEGGDGDLNLVSVARSIRQAVNLPGVHDEATPPAEAVPAAV